nr:hypothetical protein [Chitinophagaceae bacterium]
MSRMIYVFLTFFVVNVANAGVLTVNNATVSPGQYNTIAAAIAAASAGDTILIHGTGINYGSITVDKRLVFIGPGHNPVDKQNTNPALLDNIGLAGGASQSRFYGLNMSYLTTNINGIAEIIISNCLVRS